MSRYPDIWSRLQEYEVSPPRELFDKVCARVKAEKSIVKGEQLFKGEDSLKGSMRRLEEHAIQPPAALRRSVEAALFNKEVRQPGKNPNPAKARRTGEAHRTEGVRRPGKGPKPVRLLAIRAAAACLVLGLAGWLMYRATVPQKAAVGAITKNIVKIPSGKDVSGTLPVTDSLSKKDSLSPENSLAGSTANDSGRVVAAVRYRQPLSFHINGQSFPIVDNDLLVSWVNFNYTEIPGFLKEAGSDGWKIQLDQYTNILVSKTMSGLMKEMNQFKANGNATRRARKSREKLDKWKKADVIQFDRSLQSNPLDPIDLAEFIFK